MPASHVVEVADRLVYTTITGVVTFDEVLQQIAALKADPDFNPDFNEIVDMSGASDVRLGYDEFKRIEELDPFSATSRRAIVVPTNPAVYGVSRMYHLIQNEDPMIKIFRVEQEAREWVKSPG
jgi:hypothetical protein